MKYKNMKIEINESQPLDEVVVELERLGYKKDTWWSSWWEGNTKAIEACGDTLQLINYCNSDMGCRWGELTTLTELKAMNND